MERLTTWLAIVLCAGCARSAIEPWDGIGLGGPRDDEEYVEPLRDASTVDARTRDARVLEDDSEDASEPHDASEPSDARAPEVVDARVQDAYVPPPVVDASVPQPADASAPQDAALQCAACPPPGNACTTLFGTCGCRLLPIGPCGPRPPFAP